VEITLNGEPRQFPEGVSLAEIVEQLDLANQRIAIEINEDLAPRSSYASRYLHSGDRVEIIQAVGGG
jgi:sulfur carrier protein